MAPRQGNASGASGARVRRRATTDRLRRILPELLTLLLGALLGLFWEELKAVGIAAAVLTLSVLAALAVVSLLMLRRVTDVPPIYNYLYPDIEFPYEVLSRKITYHLRDGELHYSRTIRVLALRDGQSGYLDRFLWTGPEQVMPLVKGHGVNGITAYDKVGVFRYYRVEFNRALRRGEEYEFEVIWPPVDHWAKSRPFVSTSTDEPTHQLIFDLLLPPGTCRDGHAEGEVMRATESVLPLQPVEVLPIADDGRVVWTIDEPKLYHHYRLRWFWSE
ncbi:hypothetical protein Rhe02_79870 [Rhizocola hellebori]|uniref:Uncharacterized protein n=1 Tax=Rhizocola hellebori TaxID=1392758 RepID=A0A8J3QHR0_9ACTN|nr:hypothetical protein [Rhizocola hellebori]GIH09920.1 hypothetical protein Rhe02_79870 [Rhizocola hellebori]